MLNVEIKIGLSMINSSLNFCFTKYIFFGSFQVVL